MPIQDSHAGAPVRAPVDHIRQNHRQQAGTEIKALAQGNQAVNVQIVTESPDRLDQRTSVGPQRGFHPQLTPGRQGREQADAHGQRRRAGVSWNICVVMIRPIQTTPSQFADFNLAQQNAGAGVLQ